MANLVSLARADDYVALFGEVENKTRLEALLKAASGYLLARLGDGFEPGQNAILDANATTVVCSMVNRALSAPAAMSGIASMTQTAGTYSASVSMLDQYMRPLPSELELLGATDGGIYTVRAGW